MPGTQAQARTDHHSAEATAGARADSWRTPTKQFRGLRIADNHPAPTMGGHPPVVKVGAAPSPHTHTPSTRRARPPSFTTRPGNETPAGNPAHDPPCETRVADNHPLTNNGYTPTNCKDRRRTQPAHLNPQHPESTTAEFYNTTNRKRQPRHWCGEKRSGTTTGLANHRKGGSRGAGPSGGR